MGVVCADGENRPFPKSTLLMEAPEIVVSSTSGGFLCILIAVSIDYGGKLLADWKYSTQGLS